MADALSNIENSFGCRVFGDRRMREALSREVYSSWKEAVLSGRPLEKSAADPIADALRRWAISQGATHYTHWFQPMTGVTAEKHNAFLSPDGHGGAVADFSGRDLVRGEADASSFPSGGLRATFEARGYTAWVPSSRPFIKGNTLCIPTAFWTYNGDVLDMKTPLLRSCAALEKACLSLLRAIGDMVTCHVRACVGAEQEYFLLDRAAFLRRPDLVYTGRTLFGARPPRGQEGSYYGALRERVSSYMADLDRELWELGIYAKTEHAEAAPGQHELAPVYTEINDAADSNQITMELMKKVALRHGMECVLHEKPFQGVNGSGKHINWSLSTDTDVNLLDPGADPASDIRFLLFLSAVIRAVDLHSDLLFISAANAANDHRLGGHEAPPSLLSVYIGDRLESILRGRDPDKPADGDPFADAGLSAIPRFIRDTADRNRTSPFAFTGNKFEFRMPGSSASIAWPGTVLNTIVADSVAFFAQRLQEADDPQTAARALILENYEAHRRILFNGNNYSPQWRSEADRRGLPSFSSSEEAFCLLTDEKNVELFARCGVFSRTELASRQEILMSDYCNVVRAEGRTLLDMARKDVLPAVVRYSAELAGSLNLRSEAGIPSGALKDCLEALVSIEKQVFNGVRLLEDALSAFPDGGVQECARYARQSVYPVMEQIRLALNEAELHTAADLWPYPTYAQLMYMNDDGGRS